MSFFKSKKIEVSQSLETEDFNAVVLDGISMKAAQDIEDRKEKRREQIFQNNIIDLKLKMIAAAGNGKRGYRFSLYDHECPDSRWTNKEELERIFPSFRFERDPDKHSTDSDLIVYWS